MRAFQKIIFFDFFFCLVKNIFDTGFEWVQPGSGVWPDSGFWDVLLGMKGDVRVLVMHSGRGSVVHARFTIRVKNPVTLAGLSRAVPRRIPD